MIDIVIAVGNIVGSPLTLSRAIKNKIDCKAYVLCTNIKVAEIIKTSKYIDEVFLINDNTDIEYVNGIKEWFFSKKFTNKPILYFTNDKSCFYINTYREWFEDNFSICLPSSEIIMTYSQKGLAEAAAREAGLEVPKTLVLSDADDIQTAMNQFAFPVILKPIATYIKHDEGFKLKIFHKPTEFEAYAYTSIQSKHALICQEYIKGEDKETIYYLFYRSLNGTLYENMGRKILQSPPGGGIMAKGRSEYNSEVSNLCRLFLEKINYVGIGGIEFKKHNGVYFFIEMNIRIEAILDVAEFSQVPISLASYLDYSNGAIGGNNIIQPIQQVDDKIYVDLLPTIQARISSKKFLLLIADFINIIFNRSIKLNIYSRHDSQPFFVLLKHTIVQIFRKNSCK